MQSLPCSALSNITFFLQYFKAFLWTPLGQPTSALPCSGTATLVLPRALTHTACGGLDSGPERHQKEA